MHWSVREASRDWLTLPTIDIPGCGRGIVRLLSLPTNLLNSPGNSNNPFASMWKIFSLRISFDERRMIHNALVHAKLNNSTAKSAQPCHHRLFVSIQQFLETTIRAVLPGHHIHVHVLRRCIFWAWRVNLFESYVHKQTRHCQHFLR